MVSDSLGASDIQSQRTGLDKEHAVEKNILKAVHDDDLEGVLKGLGILGDFNNQRLKCAFCGDLITWDNLHSLFPDSGAIKCACSKPACVKELFARIDRVRS